MAGVKLYSFIVQDLIISPRPTNARNRINQNSINARNRIILIHCNYKIGCLSNLGSSVLMFMGNSNYKKQICIEIEIPMKR